MKYAKIGKIDKLPYELNEAFNRLRVNLGFCGDQYKTITITSSVPNEGKSFVSFHLWRMLAESGKKVILVDADIRKSEMRSRYNITTQDGSELMGLSHLLSSQMDINNVIYKTNIDNGYILPAARTVSNASLLFQNEKLPQYFNVLKNVFDYIIVDTPPLINVADGGLIASFCDGAVLVVRSEDTPRKIIASSIKEIERSNCKLLGVVLNRSESKENGYYYYKKYGRYKKYGKYGKYGKYYSHYY